MKIKNLLLSLLLVTTILLYSCQEKTMLNANIQGEISSNSINFIDICDCSVNLVYDSMTRIVYIKSPTAYTAYYAPNGLPYKYNPENNTFEEISNKIDLGKMWDIVENINLENCKPFEVEVDENSNEVTKCVLRLDYDLKRDISIVFREGVIITCWINSKDDLHCTLDESKYEK